MEHAARGDKASLTGVWHGLFSYPRLYDPTSFVAVLIDSGMTFSGTTHEPCAQGKSASGLLYAMIQGRREGSAVIFTKTYDGTAGWTHTVEYEGTLNADATEIEGRWRVPTVWSGKFLMVRSGTKEEAATRKAMVPADQA